jgi:WD40-like Beta Propeller Repeat
VWLRDGRLAFNLHEPDGSGGLYQMRVDTSDGSTTGPLTLLAGSPDGYTLWVSASADGSRMVVSKSRGWMDIYAVDLLQKGGPSVERMTLARNVNEATGWTHDGKSILLYSNRTGRNQIFRQQLGQDDAEPLIQGPDDDQEPAPSPDGKWILYWSTMHGGSGEPPTKRLMRYPVAGGAPEEILEAANDDAIAFACPFAAAAGCILARPENDGLSFYQLDPLHGLGKQITAPGKISASHWSLSPDGSLIATTTRKDRGGVLLVSVADATQHSFHVSPITDLRDVYWAADGRSLFVLGLNHYYDVILRIHLDGKMQVVLDRGKDHAIYTPLPSPDGRHLVFSELTWESNNWLLENF